MQSGEADSPRPGTWSHFGMLFILGSQPFRWEFSRFGLAFSTLRLNNYTHLAQHCLSSPGNITAARIVGIDNDIAPTAILQWRQNNHGGFLNEVKYLSGRFIIERNGYYFIYSQVTFIEHSINEHDKLSHSIYRQTPLNNEKLVESVRSHCRLQTGESDSSRFVGSVFLLNKGDEIYVHVTDPTKVSRAEHANYFGLHII
ncbi:hypothetical protein FSP39_021477 [Pinctada imbricata]|uniref:THD domain-containing protein n=1 Tax=Pinctada imbricata TaxID=66713 RepID=A0AA88YJ24_PINIB|nr:hypothetical protein FSP39_021477 [Pinctada imbricata]